ncbi:competence protein ComEC [Sanguibacter gelidistatuariae]|uniref:Competence protein ComEC n=1 Tax=Sanguibacter gelidistatuariae TaxID=1814289 RepID=A0A1G6RXH5_9MICO|nr:ComEC/Rec2 family competence protein [Sanguibacter gelidistatuariae]SDD09084.1 competence protein ComEC [Sanguibacter gelidistatuariae]
MRVLDLRLAPAAATGWIAAIVLVGQPASTARWAVLVVLGLCAGCSAGLVAAVRHGQPTRFRGAGQVALTIGVLTCVSVAVAGQLTAREQGIMPSLLARGAHVELAGAVVSEPHAMATGLGGEQRFRLTVRAASVTATVDATPTRGPVHGDVLLIGGAELLDVPYGSTVMVDGRLRPVDPGSATSAMLLVDTSTAGSSAVTVTSPPGPVIGQVNAIRAAFMEVCARLPDQARGLVPGIAIGDTSMLDPDLDQALVTTSLTHMTAVSGSHFAIIAAATFWLCALIRLPRWGRAVGAALVLTGFVLLVHPEPSVLRAGVMGALALLAVLLGRTAQAIPALCTTVVVLLVIDPFLARSFGFALSVLATAGLVVGVAPITRALERWLPSWLALALAVPLAAQLACAPVIVLLDPSVSLYSVPANLLAAPALVSATVLGVLGALCAPWWPAAAWLLAQVAGWSTWWIAEVATTFAAAPAARLPWPGGGGGALLLAVLTLAAIAAAAGWPAIIWELRTRLFVLGLARSPSVPRRGRTLHDVMVRSDSAVLRAAWAPVRVAVIVLAVVVAAAVVAFFARPPWLAELAGGNPAGPAGWPADWEVAMCDVGQGDAMLVRTGPGRALMVDVGPAGGGVGRCLAELGITDLDLLVLTHFHADHVGALDEVLAATRVESVLVSPVLDPGEQAAAVAAELDDAGVEWSTAQVGASGEVPAGGAEVAWQVLAAGGGSSVVKIAAAKTAADDTGTGGANDGSVVLAITTEHLSVMALGDLESAGQAELLATLKAAGAGEVDVVKMAHHGSRTQDAGLARFLSPEVTLVSSGAGNTYGHPTQSALDLYRSTGSAIVRTDTCSTFALVVRDGQTLVAGTCP